MKRSQMLGATALISVCAAGLLSAADLKGPKTPDGKRKMPAPTKEHEAPRKADKAQAGSPSAAPAGKKLDPSGKAAAHSKQKHDTAKRTIDNMK